MKIILNNQELLIINVPVFDYYKITNVQVETDLLGINRNDKVYSYIRCLPQGNYQIVNTLSNITEDECKNLVELGTPPIGYVGNKDFIYGTAIGAFKSLVSACYELNKPTMEKYGYIGANSFDAESGWVYEDGEKKYYEDLKKWEEENTNLLIFKKITPNEN